MDSTGYDAVWLAEHHFSTYSVCPSVHVMAMHAADITQNIRIGTAVSLAAFYNPLRLAEDVALLDHLSGGRINWGAGRGFDAKEFAAFDVKREESYPRFRENVEIVLKAWTNDKFSHHGQFHHIDEVEVLPKPLQDPMPYWIACSSYEAIEWAGTQGHPILLDPHASQVEMGNKVRAYQETLDRNNHAHAMDTPIARLIAIGRTSEEADMVARSGAEWMFGSYFNTSRDDSEAARKNSVDRLEDYVANTVIHGTADEVADQLLELEETMPLKYLMAAPLSHRSFELLTDEVIPRIA